MYKRKEWTFRMFYLVDCIQWCQLWMLLLLFFSLTIFLFFCLCCRFSDSLNGLSVLFFCFFTFTFNAYCIYFHFPLVHIFCYAILAYAFKPTNKINEEEEKMKRFETTTKEKEKKETILSLPHHLRYSTTRQDCYHCFHASERHQQQHRRKKKKINKNYARIKEYAKHKGRGSHQSERMTCRLRQRWQQRRRQQLNRKECKCFIRSFSNDFSLFYSFYFCFSYYFLFNSENENFHLFRSFIHWK